MGKLFSAANIIPMSMLAPFKQDGRFQLDGNSLQQPSGPIKAVLSFTPDGGVWLDPAEEFIHPYPHPAHVRRSIIGTVGLNVPVSLCQWHVDQDADPAGTGRTHDIYRAQVAIVGLAIPVLDEARFTSFEFSFDGLDDWCGWNPFWHHHFIYGATDTPTELKIERPDPIVLTAEDGRLAMTIEGHVWRDIDYTTNSATGRYRTAIIVEFREPAAWSEIADMQDKLMILFMMLCGRGLTARHMLVRFGPDWLTQTAAVLQRRATTVEAPAWPAKVFASFADLGRDGFESVVRAWLKNRERLETVYDMLASELRTPNREARTQVFHGALCLEALHRAVYGTETYADDATFQHARDVMLTSMPAETPPELREGFKNALGRANELGFASRIRRLFEVLPPQVREMITDDPQRFTSSLRDTRNQYAHLTGEGEKKKPFPRDRMGEAYGAIEGLLLAHLLALSGVPEETILAGLKRLCGVYQITYRFDI